jgi:PAS domain S-box-containing protein
MTDKAPPKKTFKDLRKRAEAFLNTVFSEHPDGNQMGDVRDFVHELQVHQVELELQNEELRRAREEAEESRNKYQDLYDFDPVGYFILDEEERIREGNLAGAALLDTAREDLIRIPFTRFILPEDQDIFYFHKKEVLKSQAPQTCELRLRKKDPQAPEPAYVLLKSVPVEGTSGRSVKLRLSVTDITERKRAEEVLRESEERFHRLFEDDLTGNFLCTPEGKILLCNPAFAAIFGFSSCDEAVGTSMLELYIDPRERDSLLEALKEQGKLGRYEAWRKRRDGEPIHVVENLVGDFNDRGELYEVKGYIFDDTKRKRAEEALKESEASLARAQSIAHLANWEMDVRTEEVRGSDELYRMFNLEAGFALGAYVEKFHPDDRAYVVDSINAALHEGRPYSIDYRIIPLADETRHVHAEGEVIHDDNGLPIKFFGTVQDITERKRLEEELRRSRDELEVRVRERTAELEWRNRELQDFAFIASHDLQEPLRKIRTFGGLIIDDSGDILREQSRDYLGRMQKAAERMQELLRSLLDYSRVTRMAEPFVETDLNKSVEVALSNLEILIGDKKGEVEVEKLPSLEADRNQMIQIFQNLIGNALKFHGSSSPPRIKIFARPVEGAEEVEAYRIFVEDNGVGFDEKYLDRIFVPFQRLHGRIEYEGVGMGLAICKKVLERHGGTITAKSAPGKGSTFIIDLPVKQK